MTKVMITHDSDGNVRVKLSNAGGLNEARRGDSTINEKTATLFEAVMEMPGVTDVFTHLETEASSAFAFVIVVCWGGDEVAAKALDKALWLRILRTVGFAWRAMPSPS